jgi:hypothetical protein
MKKLENKIQQEIVIWFKNNHCLKTHSPRCCIFSVPNEMQMRFKMTGLLSGASDLVVLLPERCIFVEVKTEIGRQSEKQKEFEQIVTDLGFEYILVRNLEQFQAYVNKAK